MQHVIFRFSAKIALLIAALWVVSGMAAAQPSVIVDKHVAIKRIEVPANAHLRVLVQLAMQHEMQAVKVAVQRQHSLKISHISWSPRQVVVIGHRLVHQPGKRGRGPMWLEEVRVTVPRHQLASTWDVNSLQKELERLGIKVKPKPQVPQVPRPTQQISG